jgi:hypothetical protein
MTDIEPPRQDSTQGPMSAITAAVVVPVKRLDPSIGLATAVHSAPGVYALLLGSGISTAASIPTGWAIVTDLVRRAAAADNPSEDTPAAGTFDPEAWWAEHGDGTTLGYSSLLNSLAATPAGRDSILKTYFEASDEDRQQGLKLTTPAHDAIADLVARGSIHVILTTNFDRLMERALEQRGIQPQVIHRSEQIAGMTPLAHAAVTIIKLHGDYADLDKRNTVDELATYPPQQDALLRRILDEYGLIISGWSGEWDTALVRAMEEAKSRRYPMFWTSYRQPSEATRTLIAQIGAVSIENTTADDLFVGLRERLQSLDKLAAPPISRELAVARLKRYLPDPVRRIDVHDLVMDEVRKVEALTADPARYPMDSPQVSNDVFWAKFDDYVTQYRADSDTLLHLLAAGIYFSGPEHTPLWTKVIQRLLTNQNVPQAGHQHLNDLSQYPTLLAVHTILAVSALADRHDLVGPILLKPTLKLPTMQDRKPAAYIAHPWRVFDGNSANSLPRWGGRRPQFAPSRLIRSELDGVLAAYEPDADQRTSANDTAEYLLGLANTAVGDQPYVGENVLRGRHGQLPLQVAQAIRDDIIEGRGPLTDDLFDGDAAAARSGLDKVDEAVARTVSNLF